MNVIRANSILALSEWLEVSLAVASPSRLEGRESSIGEGEQRFKSALTLILLLLLLPVQLASAQNEIAWQISSTPIRPIDPIESPQVSGGYALIGVGDGVGVYDIESGAPIRDISLPPPNPIERRTFAASNGKLLISDTIWVPTDIRGHSRAFVFDIDSGKQLSQFDLQTPKLRTGLGASVAMNEQIGLLTSLSCLDTCFDEERFTVRGVVDAFDLKTGEHLFEIVAPDNSVFGQGLAIGDGVIAVSARSRSLDVPGRVLLYDASSGDLVNTLTPNTTTPALGHNFGFDLDIDNNQLVVGDNPDLLGHGVLGNGKGVVSVYDLSSYNEVGKFSTDDVRLEGTPGFGTSVAIADGRIVVGAPNSGLKLSVARPEMLEDLDSGACAESFSTGGPCFEPRTPTQRRGAPIGQVQLVDVETGGSWSRSWNGGDGVAIGDGFALITRSHQNQTSVYAISLEGLQRAEVVSADIPLRALGDIDDDGLIAFADFLILSANYGQEASGIREGDLDQDGVVGFRDFLILSENFSTASAAVASVPEPSHHCVWLASAMGVLLCQLRTPRRRN